MIALFLIVTAAAFVSSMILTLLVMSLGRKRGLIDTPGVGEHTKPNMRPVPNVGGIAIYLTIALPIAGGLLLAWFGQGLIEAVAGEENGKFAAAIREITPSVLTILGAMTALHVLGLIDDRKAIAAWPKLLIMVGVATALTLLSGERLLTLADGFAGGPWLSYVITVLWLVLVINAINFMDNMDGVAATVVTIAAAAILVTIAVTGSQWKVGLLYALLIGACGGFLVFNFPKASVFMGDGGSLVIGLVLAYLIVRTTYTGEDVGAPWYAVFMPIVVLAVPLYDFLSVVLIRLAQGKSPMVGDQQHFSHRLRARGLSDRQVWLVMAGATAVTGISGVLLWGLDSWLALLIPAQVALVLVLIAVYEHGTSRTRLAETPANG